MITNELVYRINRQKSFSDDYKENVVFSTMAKVSQINSWKMLIWKHRRRSPETTMYKFPWSYIEQFDPTGPPPVGGKPDIGTHKSANLSMQDLRLLKGP